MACWSTPLGGGGGLKLAVAVAPGAPAGCGAPDDAWTCEPPGGGCCGAPVFSSFACAGGGGFTSPALPAAPTTPVTPFTGDGNTPPPYGAAMPVCTMCWNHENENHQLASIVTSINHNHCLENLFVSRKEFIPRRTRELKKMSSWPQIKIPTKYGFSQLISRLNWAEIRRRIRLRHR